MYLGERTMAKDNLKDPVIGKETKDTDVQLPKALTGKNKGKNIIRIAGIIILIGLCVYFFMEKGQAYEEGSTDQYNYMVDKYTCLQELGLDRTDYIPSVELDDGVIINGNTDGFRAAG